MKVCSASEALVDRKAFALESHADSSERHGRNGVPPHISAAECVPRVLVVSRIMIALRRALPALASQVARQATR